MIMDVYADTQRREQGKWMARQENAGNVEELTNAVVGLTGTHVFCTKCHVLVNLEWQCNKVA